MPAPKWITSVANPLIKQTVRLREHRQRRRTGLLIAEGFREVLRARAAGLRLQQLFLCPDRLDELGQRDAAEQLAHALPDAAVVRVSPAVLGKLAYRQEPEGLLAVVEQPRWALAALPPADARTLMLVAVGIEKPGNLGAMVRTAEAAGCQAVLAAGGPVDAFNPNAIRSSTGAVFSLPVISAAEDEVLAHLAQQHIRIAAATPQGGTPHTEAKLTGALAIVIGPEDTGLDERWLAAADRAGHGRVMIPMHGRTVDSLNASAAAAVLLFEALRQRGGGQ